MQEIVKSRRHYYKGEKLEGRAAFMAI